MLVVVNPFSSIYISNLRWTPLIFISFNLMIHTVIGTVGALAAESLVSIVALEWWEHLLVVATDIWVV